MSNTNSGDSLKPLAALCKAYRGGEWLETALESVREQCEGVVVVTSEGPWKEVSGKGHLPENCREPLRRFRLRHPDFRVQELRPSSRQTTEEQYALGMKEIRRVFGEDCGVLLLDTDEVWESGELLKLRQAMTEDRKALCFRSGIWTYLRSPLWQVTPKETARVAVALARPGLPTGKSRLANLHSLYSANQIRDVDCSFHHFGYVRNDPQEITSKLTNCTTQDTVPVLEGWKERVWNRLPEGRDIHPQRGFEKCWGGVQEIPVSFLPEVVMESEAFWAGMVWHGECFHKLFTEDNPGCRSQIKTMDPQQCPATVVSESLAPALSRLDLPTSILPRLRMSLRETAQLAALAGTVQGGEILEIGSGKGGSIATLMRWASTGVRLTAVDPYLPYDEQNQTLCKGVREGSAEEFCETVALMNRALGRVRNVTLIPRSSEEACRGCADNSLSLLLVDGNHSYSHCKQDLDLWWPRVQPGGLVLVHDYATRFPGVIQAVQEFEKERGVQFALPLRSTLAWLRK